MSLIADDLQDKCRRIVRNLKKNSSEPTPATFVGREIALTLDHMDKVRERQRVLGARFVEKELYIDTQIMNLESRPSLANNWLEQTRLRNEFNRMLDRAEWHAQRLAIESESTLQQLQSRLLELWNMYNQLSIEHGDTTSTA